MFTYSGVLHEADDYCLKHTMKIRCFFLELDAYYERFKKNSVHFDRQTDQRVQE